MEKNILPLFPCQIPELNLSCYGCCGRKMINEKEVEKDIQNNTNRFKSLGRIPTKLRLFQFRDRYNPDPFILKPSGICSNLVKFNNNIYACPLHKHINKIVPKKEYNKLSRKDLRYTYCDLNFDCDTLKWWKRASNSDKEKFLALVKSSNYSTYQYSMDNVTFEIIKKLNKTK